ncbi:MAG: magnesium transporter [Puniceicoccales bacterium]|jgi:magnesium transporter|nr:magnesium transporter [Puniceicoccales bacterium]
MRSPALTQEIKSLVDARDFAGVRSRILQWPPADLAELLTDMESRELAITFRLLPKPLAADVFEYFEHDKQEELIQALGRAQVASILNEMSDDDRTAFLEEVPEHAVRLLGLLSPEEQRVALQLLGYPEDSVGRLMTTRYLTARPDWTVAEALEHLRETAKEIDHLNVIFVVNDKGKVLGWFRLREFLLRPPSVQVKEFMDTNYVALHATDPQEDAVSMFKKYDRTMLPVVDATDTLLGAVTVDDVLDVAEEEATEDIQQMGGQAAFHEPYLDVSFLKMLQKRAGWLVVLFLGETLTATAMSYFEDEIAKATVLALFIPLIIASGGNSGSQSSTLVIRAIALEEARLRDWWRVLKRELVTGFGLGAILGIIGFMRVCIWQGMSNVTTIFTNYGDHWVLLGLTVFTTLLGVVLWGSIAGAMMPFLMKRLGFDPAVSSAPFVATIVDVTGLLIYFSVAYALLHGTVL